MLSQQDITEGLESQKNWTHWTRKIATLEWSNRSVWQESSKRKTL